MARYHELRVDSVIVFDTAFRIGSGHEGRTMSDLGVVTDPSGEPFLPGSSLKGKLRSSAERLAPHLRLRACLLDHSLSGEECCSCQDWAKETNNSARLRAIRACPDAAKRLQMIDDVTCDVCRLFGSPLKASKVLVSDGRLESWAGVIQVRDGVVIDRDSETAVSHLKYDYETVPAGARFGFSVEVSDPTPSDEALLGAVLLEWGQGFIVGGSASRGLGRARLDSVVARSLDLTDPSQMERYLTSGELQPIADWEAYVRSRLQDRLARPGPGGEQAC